MRGMRGFETGLGAIQNLEKQEQMQKQPQVLRLR